MNEHCLLVFFSEPFGFVHVWIYQSAFLTSDDSFGINQLAIDGGSAKRQRTEPVSLANLDADEPRGNSDDDSSSDDEEEDDTAELMAELNRIKKEREAEQVRRALTNVKSHTI